MPILKAQFTVDGLQLPAKDFPLFYICELSTDFGFWNLLLVCCQLSTANRQLYLECKESVVQGCRKCPEENECSYKNAGQSDGFVTLGFSPYIVIAQDIGKADTCNKTPTMSPVINAWEEKAKDEEGNHPSSDLLKYGLTVGTPTTFCVIENGADEGKKAGRCSNSKGYAC